MSSTGALSKPETVAVASALRLISLPMASWWYLWHMLWPVGLSAYYDSITVNRLTISSLVLPAVALLILGIAIWRMVRRDAALSMLLWWFPLTAAPVIASVMRLRTHDRYLYVPSFPLAIGAA